MIRVTRQWGHQFPDDEGGTPKIRSHYYRLAGQSTVFQTKVDALNAFSEGSGTESGSIGLEDLPALFAAGDIEGELKYQGLAPFDNVMRNVKCWKHEHLLKIAVDDEAICLVDMDNDHIHVLNEDSFDHRLNLEVITGPALIILLAKRDVYCLHAGSIATEYGNIALVAESGVGKSTLSAHIDPQWQQLSDDILPIHLRGDHFEIFEYPQLKLPVNATELPQPENSSIDLIIRLNPQANKDIVFKRLSRTDALIQIVRHTVAAKIFDSTVMIEHARFAKLLSGEVPVVEMKYPRDLNRLAQLRSAIVKYLREQEFN